MQPFLENRISRLQVSLSAAAPFPEHLHSQIELLYLFEGSATLSVGGKAQPMQPGDLCVCFPGVVHGYLHAENARALMLIFSPDISVDFPALLERTHPADPLLRRQQLPEDIPLCMEQLLRESCGGFDERVLRGYLQVVLARVLPLLTLNSREPGDSDLVYEILKYLSKHYTEPVTLAVLAKALGVSHSCLSHTFSERIGISFRTYLNTLRADRACLLLRSTRRSVADIAYDCGFETLRTFNRVFVQLYSQTPTAYRSRFFPDNP